MKKRLLSYFPVVLALLIVSSAAFVQTQLNGRQIVSHTVTATQLDTPGVSAGTWGDATHVPQITTTTDGRLTLASNVAITGGGSGGSGGGAGALVLLESHTASSSATLDFTTRNATGQSGATFQSDFDDYIFYFVDLVPASNGVDLLMEASTNGGSTFDTGSNYTNAEFQADQSTFSGTLNQGATGTAIRLINVVGNASNNSLTGHEEVSNPGSSIYKKFAGQFTTLKSDGNYYVNINGARYSSTTAVNAMRVTFSSGNISSGSVRVYGIAKTASLGTVTKIAETTTSGSQTSVDFASIPSTYTHLQVIWQAADTQSGTSSTDLMLKINADATAADYTSSFRFGSQNAAALLSNFASTTQGVQVGFLPQAGNTGIAAGGELRIANYPGTTFHKRVIGHVGDDDGTNNGTNWSFSARWKSTAAINELTFLTDGTAFANGSVFTLLGIQ